MNLERSRLLRLQRLERVRALAKQAAAREAAEAEGTLAQLEALAERTGRLASDYARRGEAMDGATLRQIGQFAQSLQSISHSTASDAAQAKGVADGKLANLAAAERRRAAAEDRADAQARSLARGNSLPAAGARRPIGTGLD